MTWDFGYIALEKIVLHSYSSKCWLLINRKFLSIDKKPVFTGLPLIGDLKGWL